MINHKEFYKKLFSKILDIYQESYENWFDEVDKNNYKLIKKYILDNINFDFLNWIFINHNKEFHRKEDINCYSFSVIFYWINYFWYFFNLQDKLSVKKNNRPIYINFSKFNKSNLWKLSKNINQYLKWKMWYKDAIKSITPIIMQMVFLWKDNKLKESEEIINNYLNLLKSSYYKIVLINFYNNEIIKKNLIEYIKSLNLKDEFFENILSEKDIKNVIKLNDLKWKYYKKFKKDNENFTIYISDYLTFKKILNYLKYLLKRYN